MALVILLMVLLGKMPAANASWHWQDELIAPAASPVASELFLGGLVGAALLAGPGKEGVVLPTQDYFHQHNFLGKSERSIELMGRWVPNITYAVGMELFVRSRSRSSTIPLPYALIMIKATTYASLVTVLLKYTVREKRPASDDRVSFPSGHTTTAFAFAGVVGALHPWYYGLGAYGLATLVGMQRIISNSHYLHDVVAGAAIGMAYGIGISALAVRESAPATITSWQWSMLPTSDGQGLQLIGGRQF